MEMNSGVAETLNGVWGSSSTNIFAVGYYGIILRYNGSTWSAMDSGTDKRLYGVWGSSSTNIFVVGTKDTYDTISASTILNYDGNDDGIWSFMRNSRSEILRSIWGSSDKNIFAVGDDGTILHQVRTSLL